MNEDQRVDDILTYIKMLSRFVYQLKENVIRKKGLKTIHVECLFYLRYKGPLSATELISLTLEDKAAISKALKILKEKEYIVYDNKGKYKEKIALTVSGEVLTSDIQKEIAPALEKARIGISDEEAMNFIVTMKKICLNLKDYLEIK